MKRSEKIKIAIASTARAVSGKQKLGVTYAGNNPNATITNNGDLRFTNVTDDISAKEMARLRGEADSAALFLKHHNQSLHYKLQPKEDKAKAIFDALEQARIESLGAKNFRGISENIASKIYENMQENGYERISERADPPVADLIALLLRQKVAGINPPEFMNRLLTVWGAWIESQVGKDLDELSNSVDSQQKFSKLSLKLIKNLYERDSSESSDKQNDEDSSEDEATGKKNSDSNSDDSNSDESDSMGIDLSDHLGDKIASKSDASKSGNTKKSSDISDVDGAEDDARSEDDSNPPRLPNFVETSGFDSSNYKVYTREFDEIVKASSLASQDELTRLRSQLDDRLQGMQAVISRLANRLQRKLMAKQKRSWQFEQEEGLLDSAKLPRIITDPSYHYLYKHEKDSDFKDTVVSILLDNSGSMRGRPIMMAALTGDILSKTLERVGVKVEVLGFTTREWKGGKSRQKWTQNGSNPNVGRLNDLRHIIYKSADSTWRSSRKNMALMLKDGILKENIDGEAILWAYSRLKQRKEQRKILIVVSDGAPVDDSTLSVNTGNFLDLHLREVIAQVEGDGIVEMVAIGIGHDVTRYYKKAVTISDVEQLGKVMMDELGQLFNAV